MSRSWVICGSYSEYHTFLAKLPMSMVNSGERYEYVSHADDLRGVQNPHGYFYGTWRDRSDIVDIMVMLKVATKQPNPQLDSVVNSWKQRYQY